MTRQNPVERLPLTPHGNTDKAIYYPSVQQNRPIRIGVAHSYERASGDHLYSQFFTQFSIQGLPRHFPLFALAAGKLPEPPLVDVIGTPGDEDTVVVGEEHACDDIYVFFDGDDSCEHCPPGDGADGVLER